MNRNRIEGTLNFKNYTLIPKKSRSEQRAHTIRLIKHYVSSLVFGKSHGKNGAET